MLKKMLKKLLDPKVIIFAVFGIALIGALLAFGDIRQVLALMASFPHIALLWFFLLMIAYEAVRCLQWVYLLEALDMRVPLDMQIFAYLSSESAKTIPIGNYFENYILERAEGTDFGRSSAATTISVLIEVAVSLAGVVVIGLGSWTGWLRPVILIGLLAFGLLAWVISKRHRSHSLPGWVVGHPLARKAYEEWRRFEQGAADLLRPRTLAIATALGTVYLILAGSSLFVITSALGLPVTYWDALAVFFFSLAFSLIFPLPVDIGVLEVSAVGAWLAVGLGRTDAVAVTLLYRVLSLAASLLISIVGIAIMHEDLRQVLRGGARRQASPPAPTPPPTTTPPATRRPAEGTAPPPASGTAQRRARAADMPPPADARPGAPAGGERPEDQPPPPPASSRAMPRRATSARRPAPGGTRPIAGGSHPTSASRASEPSSSRSTQEERR
jgi:uncharacterized protein (TIRG00374 family)